MVNGEITVFLSLVFLLLLSFTGAVLESASIQVLKNEKRADAGRAAESVFAEYQRELLSEYEIFAVETGYESGAASEANILNRLSFYGTENMQSEVAAVRYLTDDNGQEFYRQAVMYEKEKTGMSAAEELADKLSIWKEQEKKSEEFGKEEKETSKELERMLQEGEQSLPAEDNPLKNVSEIRSGSLLNIVTPEGFTVSQRAVRVSEQVSHRSLREGHGVLKEKDAGAVDTVFFNLYLLEKFCNAAADKSGGALQYELEYLLEGQGSDVENLERVVKKICGFRFAANYAYLLTDTVKQGEAETLAVALSTLILLPEISTVVKHAILLAWAYAESVVDVRTLLAGKKVPLQKSGETWQVSMSGLMNFGEGESVQEGEDHSEGLSYERYLQMLLLLEKKEALVMRSLDLVEMNMRTRLGQAYFQADACMTGAEFAVVCPMRRGIKYGFSTIFQYQ